MAIYHYSIKIISRGKGKSAVAAAAYRSGETFTNQYDGITHDFTRKGGIVHTEILLPPHAPPEFTDRSTLWNSVEKIEKARNSQLARELEIALPAELDQEQQIQLVREYVKDNFVSAGMCADVAIHDKADGNPHAHIMLTMRPLEQSGEWGAKSKKEYILDKDGQRIQLKNGTFKNRKADTVDWNNREKAEAWRQAWADTANRYLAAQDRPERIDHRSYKRQGIEQIPTVHTPIHSPTLLEMLNQAYKEADTLQSRYGKIHDLKAYTQAVNFLQDKSITTLVQLQETVSEMKKRYRNLNGQIKQNEKLIHERKELIDQSEKYLKYQPYHKKYLQTKPRRKEAYADDFRAELTLYEAAERYLKQALGKGGTIKLKTWKAEVAAHTSEKNSLYSELRRLKVEVQKAEAVKKCVEQAIQPKQMPLPTRKHDMEL